MDIVFQWIVANWQAVCGWSAAFYFVYQVGRVFSGAVTSTNNAVTRFEKAESAIKRVEETVSLLSTNHLPHIQAEIEKTNEKLEGINDTLSGVREDLRIVLFQKLNNE